MLYYTYMVRCADRSLYTGWTLDVAKRVAAHNGGRGAKYTRSRRPVTLAWCQGFATQHEAMHWEWEIKHWPKDKKEAFCSHPFSLAGDE
ncbi:GIY-YIG nuclease family protein [Megasphaera sp.]|uniref:GIY-YIG nuclease family protein n=1 Tax=Megasphaera sp. TaxID=2023260 RepID=UPI0025D789AE|nr:GIY-YIG nuclease family protein [uncultured Megasphaera sp.]